MPSLRAPRWRGGALKAVLFDLDGTLLDTVADAALALNRTLAEFGLGSTPVGEVRDMVGRGQAVLIERAAAAQGRVFDEAVLAGIVQRFFHHYGGLEDSGEESAQAYSGAAESLRSLHAAGLRIAVVTNKLQRFADSLLKRRDMSAWVDVLVGGDTCGCRKPDPRPLLFACESLRVEPSDALMIGDSINDVQAARAAGMPVICVTYGYNEGRDPRTLECDALLDTLAELAPLLESR